MIIRIALFFTLLAGFYYYCNEDNNSKQYRGPNDINMIEVPREISPSFIENPQTASNKTLDSSYFFTNEFSEQKMPAFSIPYSSLKNY